MIELALPAGSLETALTAFSAGADAVYFGLKEFSARKGAVNFSIEDLKKIRRYALDSGKQIYIAINTLIDDSSYGRLLPVLEEVEEIGNDGIIIQDLGVTDIIKRHFPSLALHASTQLAVHTTSGVRQLQDMGFERVVLSRELNLDEIRKIRTDCPDIEIKAFIHGALCYGFSGVCSASYLKCGRSANGGECAQICRSWFQDQNTGKKGFFFSMEDMCAGQLLLELDKIGIDSAKVEGRLKSPEYVAAVTRYYRSILDKGQATIEQEDNMLTTFSRRQGYGYLDYRKDRPRLVETSYPGHVGLPCGRITKQNDSTITVDLSKPIESHDGLQYFTENRLGLMEPKKFSALVIKSNGNTAVLKLHEREDLRGRTLYKISDSTKREKTPSTNIPGFRRTVDVKVNLKKNRILASALGITTEKELSISEAKNPIDPEEVVRKHFLESGDSGYTLGKLSFTNNSGLAYPFLPPSIMKDFRRTFYSSLDSVEREPVEIEEPTEQLTSIQLPKRGLLSKDLPWSMEPTEIEGRTWFTFPPVTFNEEKLFRDMEKAVQGHSNVTIGLNNIAQIAFAKAHPEYDYFIDIYLYVSSRFTARALLQEIPNLVGGYLWFERSEKSGQWPFEPTITRFRPPAFISRACYRHDAMGESCKGCSMHHDYRIRQEGSEYLVKVRNCLTVVEETT